MGIHDKGSDKSVWFSSVGQMNGDYIYVRSKFFQKVLSDVQLGLGADKFNITLHVDYVLELFNPKHYYSYLFLRVQLSGFLEVHFENPS